MFVFSLKHKVVSTLFLVIAISICLGPSCLGQSTVHWELTAYGRRAALADPGQEQPGFEEMNPASTGLRFVNPLEQSYSDLNQNLVGSGVALGDVNGDDLCDLFFASLNGTCRLFLNRGGWTFEDQTLQGGLVIKNQLATGVLLEDLDADGDLDLVVAFNGSGLRWWENNGRGQFGEVTPENFRSRNWTDQPCGGRCGSERSSGSLCCQLRRKYHPQWSIGAHPYGKRQASRHRKMAGPH